MSKLRRGAIVTLTTLLLALALGCEKVEGGKCAGAEQVCADKSNALVCRSNAFVSVSCGGPLACSKFQGKVSCDTSVGAAGAPCMGEEEEYACSADKKEALVCKGGRFTAFLECRGAAGCTMNARRPICDLSVAAKGDPCKMPESFACSDDGKQMLICRTGHFETHRYCRGQFGCAAKPDGPACDESVSLLGDPCGLPGQLVCSVDGKTELICQGGVYMRSRACKTGCAISSRPGRPLDCN